MVEIHICPILMRTVKFIDGECSEQCKEDCPVTDLTRREDEDNG
ncbi:MAG TPA: hypothetical protein PLA74_07440 [Syntrophales bacterium]|nr:hypothetical protein [Syntrophales bacterium]